MNKNIKRWVIASFVVIGGLKLMIVTSVVDLMFLQANLTGGGFGFPFGFLSFGSGFIAQDRFALINFIADWLIHAFAMWTIYRFTFGREPRD